MTLFTYVNEVNTNLICCICHSPFFQPVVTTTCFHTFCRVCIEKSLEQQSCCPVDRSPLTRDDLRPENLLLRNMVDELFVECSNKDLGCTATCQRQLLELHKRESCLFVSVPCKEPNCDQILLRKDLGKHDEICCSREDVCDLCGALVKSAEMQLHNDLCLEQEASCSLCQQTMRRSHVRRHAEACPKADVRCGHSARGCAWTGERQHRPSHVESCPYESIKAFFDILDQRFATICEENSVLRHRLESTESTVRSSQAELARIRQSLGRWCSTEDEVAGLTDRISDMNLHNTADAGGFDIPRWRATNPLAPITSFSPEASPISSTHEVTDSTNLMNQAAFAQIAHFFPAVPNHSSISVDSEDPGSMPPSAPSAQPQVDPNYARFPFAATRPSLAFPPPPIRFPDVTNPRTNGAGVSLVQLQHRQHQQRQNGTSSATAALGPAGTTPNGNNSNSSSALSSHAPRVPALDRSSTIEGALAALQRSVASVSSALDALARRTDVALTTENLRMNEEVGALRAIVHGLRMQVHALLSDRSAGLGGGGWAGLGMGSALPVLTTTTATYLNHPPPPQHVPLVINSTSTTSTTKL